MNKQKRKLNDGHRERMRAKYQKVGFYSFTDHELFEVLLYAVQKRQNTNGIGHKLIERFGSVRGIFEASKDELLEIAGVGEQSVMFFDLISELMRRYHSSEDKREKFTTIESLGEFFVHKYIGIGVETVYVLLLDNSLGLIDFKMVHEGSINAASFELSKVYQYAFSRNAPYVVVAHNHPRGVLIPSDADKRTTQMLSEGLGILGITLIEHFIVTDSRYLPIMRNSELLSLRKRSEEFLQFRNVEYLTGKLN